MEENDTTVEAEFGGAGANNDKLVVVLKQNVASPQFAIGELRLIVGQHWFGGAGFCTGIVVVVVDHLED